MRKKVKEANGAIEEVRNKEEVKRRKDDTETRSKEGKRGGSKQESENQLKQPTGVLPDRISCNFTPLMAQDWALDIRLYVRTYSNLDILYRGKQGTL